MKDSLMQALWLKFRAQTIPSGISPGQLCNLEICFHAGAFAVVEVITGTLRNEPLPSVIGVLETITGELADQRFRWKAGLQ